MVDMIEGHPIPQDITGFQFRLIGDMTVKQFAYLGVCLIVGWILFSLPINIFIKLPLALFSVIGGVILAFVPIEGVPADTILMLFFRALIKPNQYVYNKIDKNFTADATKQNQTIVSQTMTPTIITTPGPSKNQLKETTIVTLPKKSTSVPTPNPAIDVIPINTVPSPIPVPPVVHEEIILPKQPIVHSVDPKSLNVASQIEQSPPLQVAAVTTNPFEQQFQDVLAQKKVLEQQLEQLRQSQVPHVNPTLIQPTTTVQPYKKVTEQPKKIPLAPFMPDVPNLIAGFIKDSRENVLPNILIEIKDKDDNPVRAFKTNALGQFASATPLLSGTYTITFEDPKKQQKFDTIEIPVTGAILPPLEITSIDEREELRKSLFTA